MSRDRGASPCGDRAFVPAASSPAVSPVPASIPSAVPTDLCSVWVQAEDNHRRYSDTGDRENDIRFLALGLAGEAGELANFVKKRWRDGDGHDEDIRLEIADVCAYAFMLASTMGMAPDDLMGAIAHKQSVFVRKMRARDASATPTRSAETTGSVGEADGGAVRDSGDAKPLPESNP